MRLSKKEAELFYKLYELLLIYANKKFNVIKNVNSREELENCTVEEVYELRNKVYEHPEIIDSFVRENPSNLSPDELKIVSEWKHFVKGDFIIFRYLKNYIIFLDLKEPPKAYGVSALDPNFEELRPFLPIMVEAVLLPFKNKITYDTFLIPYSITFGGGIRKTFNNAYQEAKSRFGIITSLPFSPERVEQSDAERLKFYLRSKENREMYQEEIENLINKKPELLMLYHQEMGKVHARTYGRRLREMGVKSGWFAILEGTLIASGTTKDEVERILQCLLPPEKRKFVYLFRLK